MKIPWTVRHGLGITKAQANLLIVCTANIDGRTVSFTHPDGSLMKQVHISRGQIGNQSNAFRAVNQWNNIQRVVALRANAAAIRERLANKEGDKQPC